MRESLTHSFLLFDSSTDMVESTEFSLAIVAPETQNPLQCKNVPCIVLRMDPMGLQNGQAEAYHGE